MNNNQQQQSQQFAQQMAQKQAVQGSAPKQPTSPAASDEVGQVAQLGYN